MMVVDLFTKVSTMSFERSREAAVYGVLLETTDPLRHLFKILTDLMHPAV